MKLFLAGLFASLLIVTCHGKPSKPTCGGRASSKNIELINPANVPRECEYHLGASSNKVRQLRVEFSMRLAQPSLLSVSNGLQYQKCESDYLSIGNLILCGVETSQHVYVPFNATAGTTTIDIKFVTAARGGGGLPEVSWNLKIRQLEWPNDAFFIAPTGCAQYFPSPTGTITSFNYNEGQGLYPENLNYAICFRRTSQTQALKLNVLSFKIPNALGANQPLEYDSNCYPQNMTDTGLGNFLMIPQAVVASSNIRAAYFCGTSHDRFSIFSTNPGPLMMVFNSDNLLKDGITSGGFRLNYAVL